MTDLADLYSLTDHVHFIVYIIHTIESDMQLWDRNSNYFFFSDSLRLYTFSPRGQLHATPTMHSPDPIWDL